LPINRLGDYELGRRSLPTEEVEAIKAALEAAGVEFTNGDEPGVKLRLRLRCLGETRGGKR